MKKQDKYEGHTPGPWSHAKSEIDGRYSIYGMGPLAYSASSADYDDAAEANAALIAAAPDLLAENTRLRAALMEIAGADCLCLTNPERVTMAALTKKQARELECPLGHIVRA